MEKLILSDEEWKMRLSEEEYYILRQHGTERPGLVCLTMKREKVPTIVQDVNYHYFLRI